MAKSKSKNDSPPIGIDTDVRESKREDAAERLGTAVDEGRVRSFDRDDKFLGWDAQQGALPAQSNEDDDRRQAHLYDDDPIRYSEDQLPRPEVLREAGLRPVISRRQTGLEDGVDATPHDGGPQTANVVHEETREPTEVDSDAPRTVEDANAAEAEERKKSSKKSKKSKKS